MNSDYTAELNRLETAIIGAILLERTAIAIVYGVIRDNVDAFTLEETRIVYGLCAKMFKSGAPVDVITIGQAIFSNNLLDKVHPAKLAEYTNKVASTANTEAHAFALLENYTKRIATKEFTLLAASKYDGIDDINTHINRALVAINKPMQQYTRVEDTQSLYDHILEMRKSGLRGYDSGIQALNRLASFAPGDLVIIAARPGMGKTTLAIQLAENYAAQDYKVDFYTYEMPEKQLNLRRLSNSTGVELEQMIRNAGNDTKIIAGIEAIAENKNLRILSADTNTATGIRANSMLRKQTIGLDAVFIDYLGLMEHAGDGSLNDQIGNTTRALKRLAQEMDIPIILLSQLSRGVESRGNKIPMLSDLRDSGNIEQDADVVLFPVRPAYYGQDVDDFGNAVTEKSLIIVAAKNRHGKPGYTYLSGNMGIFRVEDETPF